MSKTININPWSNREQLFTRDVSCVYGHYVSGFIDNTYSETNRGFDVRFVCNTLNGFMGEKVESTNVMRDGAVIHLGTIDDLIQEFILLKEQMLAIQVANKLEKM